MKVSNISAVLLSALFSVAISAAPLGEVSSENGKIFSGENYMVVKKDMKKGEQIKPHDHPALKRWFLPLERKLWRDVESDWKHTVGAGSVLRFGGDAVIEAVATEDADVAITLIK